MYDHKHDFRTGGTIEISAKLLLTFRSLSQCENDTAEQIAQPFARLKPVRRSPRSSGDGRAREHVLSLEEKYGGLGTPEISELRQRREESAKVKKLVADLKLESSNTSGDPHKTTVKPGAAARSRRLPQERI
jgi:hypothetical protein